MPPPNSGFTTGKETPPAGVLEALQALRRLGSLQARPGPQIEPQKLRQAAIRFLELVTADDDAGARARAALRQLSQAARELLVLFQEAGR